MKAAKLEKVKKKLVEAGIMAREEQLIDYFQANYVHWHSERRGTWKRGWAYFTDKRLIVIRGFLGGNLVIPYQNIRGLEKCLQTCFPIGITITHEDAESGETKRDMLSMMKRKKWLEFLSNKSGVAVT